MSTIDRVRGARRGAAGRGTAQREGAARGDGAARGAGALTARTVRVRNVCLQHAAAHLHLPIPTDAQLDALPADMTLGQSVTWLRAAHGRSEPATFEPVAQRTARALASALARAAGVVAIVAVALAVTYGQAQ